MPKEAQIEEVYIVDKCSNVEIVSVETHEIQVCLKGHAPRGEALLSSPPAGDDDEDEWQDRLEAREQRMSEGLF